MNRDELPLLQRSLPQLARLPNSARDDVEERDSVITLVGVVQLAEETANKSIRSMEAVVRPATGDSRFLASPRERYRAAIPLRIDAQDAAEPLLMARTDPTDLEATTAAFRDWWSEMLDSEGIEDARPTLVQHDQGRPRQGLHGHPATGWSSLTANELRVVELVALGLTNREVGQQMFLSRHTIDSHLRHVFDKLGIRSRVQLARYAFEQLPPLAKAQDALANTGDRSTSPTAFENLKLARGHTRTEWT